MSMSSNTRASGSATTLPGAPVRPEALSRRNALGAAAVVALSLAALGNCPVTAQAAPVAIVMPASPDADLIAFANRVAALAHRCRAAADHRSTIEDRMFLSCPRPDPLPKPAAGGRSIAETMTPTATIYTIARPHERDPAWVRWEEATAATQATYEEQKRAAGARLGLPDVERRHDRMMRRSDRWANQLVPMRPATVEGLSAKAGALVAVLGDDPSAKFGGLDTYADLVLSVLADAVRLGAGCQA